MKPDRVPAIVEQEKERVPATGAKRRPRKHIVLVERNAALADLLREVLWQETPCHIIRVTTGEQALRLVPQLRPDLLIVGFHLADMTGMEVYEHLHTIEELVSLPTILLGTPQPGARTGPPLSIRVDQAFDVAALLQTIMALLGEERWPAWFHGYAARQ
jgi:CheY-like chemotaxis protein